MAIHDVTLDSSVVSARARVVVRQILAPAVLSDRESLRLEVFQTQARGDIEAALKTKAYRPATVPFRWGPAWSTAWFRLTGRVPRRWAGQTVVLHAVCNGEALVWRDAVPYHGISPNHSRIPLLETCQGGERVTLHVEAAANQWFGRLQDVPADQTAKPALMAALELACFDPAVWQFMLDIEFAADLLDISIEMFQGFRDWNQFTKSILRSPDTRRLTRGLFDAMNRLREHDLAATIPAAHRILRRALQGAPSASPSACRVVGHSHIDVAWLWPLAETRRKIARTFSTMLRLMERDPEFVYVQSQAQLYAYLEADYPALFKQVKQRISEGRWEAGGGMWVEADCNLASGEALIRQLLHGIRFWRQRLGPAYRCRYLWLPDVFGYSSALPQIMRHCGLDTFFTQKISWNETNRFPHTTFHWQGIDGSRVLAHFFPTDNYNGQATPRELARGDFNNQQADLIPCWLNPVGYGDGGGGPTSEMLQRIQTADRAPLLPRVRYQLPNAFSDDLHQMARNRPLPVWQGELYLELHRGTLTTQAQVKQCNRWAENGLRETELWSFLAWGGSARYPAATLDRLWKNVLLQQFHDVLPGSSIAAVYEETRRDYAAVLLELTEQREKAMTELASRLPVPATVRQPHAVFNAIECSRDGVIELPERGPKRGAAKRPARLAYVRQVPALGLGWYDAVSPELPAGIAPVKATARTLENGMLRVRLDAAGRVRALWCRTGGRDAVRAGNPLNQWVLYADRPNQWDAWDINRHYLEMGDVLTTRVAMRVIENGPLRAVIEVKRPLGTASEMVQHIRLDAGSPRLDFETWISWGEAHRLLRVLHPVDVDCDFATYDVQFGYVRRPTHCNTSWDGARFESCAHTWMDLSDPGFGVALLNNAKYGHSCIGHVMGLSVLRAPRQPDETADLGDHCFTYSLMPHAGDPITAGVPEQARALNHPLRALPLSPDRALGKNSGTDGARGPLAWDIPAGVRVECFKQAEDSGDLVIRLVETAGRRRDETIRWPYAVRSIQTVDALEQPTRLFRIRFDRKNRRVTVPFEPFCIRTLRVKV